jgi:lactoylglutathione lyase
MNAQPNIKQTVPFFWVTDMAVSLRFYVDGLGFTLINQWEPRGTIEWCWLTRDAGALMLQQYREGNKPADKPGVGMSICFQCVDALALYHEFKGKGLDVTEPFVGNNMWTTSVKDPDGFPLYFGSPTDVPEETTYSDWIKVK